MSLFDTKEIEFTAETKLPGGYIVAAGTRCKVAPGVALNLVELGKAKFTKKRGRPKNADRLDNPKDSRTGQPADIA